MLTKHSSMAAMLPAAAAPGGGGAVAPGSAGATAHGSAGATAHGSAGATAHGSAGAGSNLLFLRESELRLAQDLLFFGYRDFTAGPDRLLVELNMGRAHHRVLHFVARRPGITVGDLLTILAITKQSLGRVLQPMIEDGYVTQAAGRTDKRQRLLSLTEKGAALERRLYDCQREGIMRAYREAGPAAVEGFRRVMRGLMGDQARAELEVLERVAP